MDTAKVVSFAVVGGGTTKVEVPKVVSFAVVGGGTTKVEVPKVVAFAVLESQVSTGQHRLLQFF